METAELENHGSNTARLEKLTEAPHPRSISSFYQSCCLVRHFPLSLLLSIASPHPSPLPLTSFLKYPVCAPVGDRGGNVCSKTGFVSVW